MSLFGRLFGKKKQLSPVERVRRILHHFTEAAFLPLTSEDHDDPSKGLLVLLFMAGATDFLCQVNDIGNEEYWQIFRSNFIDEFGGYSEDEADVIVREVANAMGSEVGENAMKEGAGSIQMWVSGEDPMAPHRLWEFLNPV